MYIYIIYIYFLYIYIHIHVYYIYIYIYIYFFWLSRWRSNRRFSPVGLATFGLSVSGRSAPIGFFTRFFVLKLRLLSQARPHT